MAKLAGLYLHLDIPFDEIEEYEAEQYVKDIGKKNTLAYFMVMILSWS